MYRCLYWHVVGFLTQASRQPTSPLPFGIAATQSLWDKGGKEGKQATLCRMNRRLALI